MPTKTISEQSFEQFFVEDLARKPYCTDELGVIHIRPKSTAAKKRYLQINQPKMHIYLVFDVDRNGAALAWSDANFLPPTWTAMNRENGHAHLVYRLAAPVCTSDAAKMAPLQLLAAIESAVKEKLRADGGYAGLLTKNPIHDDWQVTYWSDHEYTLDEFANELDLKGHPIRRGIEATGLGRNVELFNNARKWAYKAIKKFWAPNYKDKWFNAVLSEVESLNSQFSTPLQYSEVKSIAKSISKWTYKHFTPSEFSKEQSKRGQKGGKKSKGGGRPVANDSARTLKPWEALGISRRTYYYKKKKGTLSCTKTSLIR